ncbi:hypothetical protein D3C84_801730 [compost metagenome]
MVSTSSREITARSSTLVNRAILRREETSTGWSERQISTSGCRPMERSSLTECWVGLVLVSPAVAMYGTRVRCISMARLEPTSTRNWRMASRNGCDSISPTVPPISTRATSASPAPLMMRRLISSVMCGMTWMVAPR